MNTKDNIDVSISRANSEMAVATVAISNKSEKRWSIKELKACINAIPKEFDDKFVVVSLPNEHSGAYLEDITLYRSDYVNWMSLEKHREIKLDFIGKSE